MSLGPCFLPLYDAPARLRRLQSSRRRNAGMRRAGMPLAKIGARSANRDRGIAAATPSATASSSQPRARSTAGIDRLNRCIRPSLRRRIKPARSNTLTCRDMAGSDTPWSSASSLMVRAPWANRRSTSRRRGLASAEKTRLSSGLQLLTIMLTITTPDSGVNSNPGGHPPDPEGPRAARWQRPVRVESDSRGLFLRTSMRAPGVKPHGTRVLIKVGKACRSVRKAKVTQNHAPTLVARPAERWNDSDVIVNHEPASW